LRSLHSGRIQTKLVGIFHYLTSLSDVFLMQYFAENTVPYIPMSKGRGFTARSGKWYPLEGGTLSDFIDTYILPQ